MKEFIFQIIGLSVFMTASFGIGYFYGLKDCGEKLIEKDKK